MSAAMDAYDLERLAGALVHVLQRDERLTNAQIHELLDEVKRRCPR